MTKLAERCAVIYEAEPEKNGWYLLTNREFKKLFETDMITVSELLEMAQKITEKVGEFDEQLKHFSSIELEEGCPVELIAADNEERYIGFAVGPVEYSLDFTIKKSKLLALEASIFFGLDTGFIEVKEVPGVVGFKFLQAYTKYLLGELEEKEWVDTDYKY